jgi:2-desacetyl-2-hydroxyethyl bacteriochlorophyllide A dehydrogenase
MNQIVLERPGVVHVRETDSAPPAEASQAVVRLRMAGICGSDLAAYRGTSPMASYPRVLGHELLVDVLECEDRPELVGQRAVVDPMIRCGGCRACRAGRYNCCAHLRVMGVHVDGGLQDVRTIDSQHLFLVPVTLADEVAVLAEPLTVAYHAVQRAAPDAGQTAVVFGAGPIGLLITWLLLRARGCRAVVIEIDERRRRIAEALGATALHGDGATLMRAVEQATGGDMADAVFEATGNASCTRMTTDLVGHAGRIVLVGWNKGPVEVDTVSLMRKEADLLGARNSRNAFPAVLQLLADGLLDPTLLITHRLALTEAGTALEILDRGQEHALKILLEVR